MTILSILWEADPEIFSLGPVTVRWYGVLFALAFFIGNLIMIRVYRLENKPEADLENLLVYMIVAVVVGARLGHCLFYDPAYYLSNPLDIFKVWEGGLASHGGAAGILFSIYLYSRNKPDQSYLWVLDRLVITIALAGCFIRLGNLMNSEIVGLPSDLPWAFVFAKCGECGMLPRHPAQLYESLSCLVLFAGLFMAYEKTREKTPKGLYLGIFMVWVFGLRMVWEFFKENQSDFEQSMLMNMGQLLSIPLVIAGIYLIVRALAKGKPSLEIA
ncbi:MAG: prolipoprotein diacylglyceryl transferase [Cytophagales bacterium]|nr:MAG: prolipoprotein diacylglyceryl transferase [Cytophagales bacterium]TAF59537.1 MAG: prolipoprotein diacylglyceryl transferase [Cytophagales bacterium]